MTRSDDNYRALIWWDDPDTPEPNEIWTTREPGLAALQRHVRTTVRHEQTKFRRGLPTRVLFQRRPEAPWISVLDLTQADVGTVAAQPAAEAAR